jgi:DNA-directed RNA polymerase specialized sigma24 family protein
MLSRVVTMDLTTRAVLVLITVERLPAVEVAVICNLPPADVAAVLSHGRALLKASPTPRTMVF